jgi:cytoskeleton protein RodZ
VGDLASCDYNRRVFEICNSLREARMRQVLDLPEIEQATKVRGRYLRALEDEQFDGLPAATYVKGFLRTYADYLGLDGQLYVDEYNSRYVAGEDDPPLRRSGVTPSYGSRVERRVVVLTLGAIVILTALFFAAWKLPSGSKNPPQNVLPPTSTQTKPAKHPAKTKPHIAAAATFTLTATAPSFVKVHLGSGSGKQVFSGTMDTNQFHRFYSKRLWIAASDPTALRATLDGKVVQLPNAVKRTGVIVTASGLKAA